MLLTPPPEALSVAGWRVAAVAVVMAVLWMTEALPIPATALIPIAAFPILGIAPVGKAAAPYANPIIFLFLGGFIVALTMERWQLHTRIALAVLSRAGNRADALIAAFMGVTAFLSMWVSNTATALMMVPIALSVTALLRSGDSAAGDVEAAELSRRFAPALLLSVAYGASIGGLGTLVGTPPNAFLAAFMLERFGLRIGFAEWMALGLPVVVFMLCATWWLLTHVIFRLGGRTVAAAGQSVTAQARAQGPLTRAQKLAAGLFLVTAGLWITRPLIAQATGLTALDDTVIAVAAALTAFVIPVDLREGRFLMDWETARRLPWGVLLLFGGGLALADAISTSGLAGWIGGRLTVFAELPRVVTVLAVVALVIFLTELTSNTATTATFLPVLATLALAIGENPLLLAVPAAVAASCAFMLPVATPPNAIVFGSGHLTVPQMARAGLLVNLTGIALITTLAYLLLPLVFGLEPGRVPDWAKTP
jgi:sodium-dependent dicarboxylate transporter 2/3/5